MVNPTYGIVELQVNYYPSASCTTFTSTVFKCPMSFLRSTNGTILRSQLNQLMTDWETLRSNTAIYDQAAMVLPGCQVLEVAGP